MLHGSDGWGKLVSELQQKEEDETEVQQQEEHEGQKPGRKRRRDGDALTDAR